MFLVLGQTLRFSEESTRLRLAENERAIVDVFADLSQNALFTRDFGDLQQYAEKLTRDPHIAKVLVADRTRRIVASADFSDVGMPLPARFTDTAERFWRTMAIGNLGMIAMEFSNRELIEASRQASARGIVIALIGMAFIAVAGVGFGFLLTRRLKTVTDAAARLASGDLGVRTGFTGRDELSIVGRTFDRMASRIPARHPGARGQAARPGPGARRARDPSRRADLGAEGRERGEERVPRDHEPRVAHAAQQRRRRRRAARREEASGCRAPAASSGCWRRRRQLRSRRRQPARPAQDRGGKDDDRAARRSTSHADGAAGGAVRARGPGRAGCASPAASPRTYPAC